MEEEDDLRRQRRGWVSSLPIETIIALLGMLATAIYTVAFLQFDVKQNTKDLDSQRAVLVAHVTQDESKQDKSSEKLDQILERLARIESYVEDHKGK